ncbi:MAG: TolC family protein [Rhodothermales bacterium]
MSSTSLRLFLVAAVLAFSARSSPGQESPRTLRDVLAAVERDNSTLVAARLDADALAFRRAQVSALPDPTAGVTYQPVPLLTARGSQRTQWRVEQMIPYPGKLRLQGEVADLSADVTRHEADVLAADLFLEAKEAYYDLYHAQRLTELVLAFRDDLRAFEEAATSRYEVGQGAQQAVLQAQVEKNRMAQQLVDLEVRRRSAAAKLARLTNQPGSASHFETTELVAPELPEVPYDALVDLSVRERSEMAALEAAAVRAEAETELSRKQLLPDFGVSLTYFDIARADALPMGGGRDALAVGVSVKLPLQRGSKRARIAESEVRSRQIDARRQALLAEIETRVDDLLYALQQEQRTLDLYDRTLLPQADATVEATLSAYTTGRTDFLNLLDAERTMFSLRTGRADALIRYLKAAVRLERALGITSLDDLSDLIGTQNARME